MIALITQFSALVQYRDFQTTTHIRILEEWKFAFLMIPSLDCGCCCSWDHILRTAGGVEKMEAERQCTWVLISAPSNYMPPLDFRASVINWDANSPCRAAVRIMWTHVGTGLAPIVSCFSSVYPLNFLSGRPTSDFSLHPMNYLVRAWQRVGGNKCQGWGKLLNTFTNAHDLGYRFIQIMNQMSRVPHLH